MSFAGDDYESTLVKHMDWKRDGLNSGDTLRLREMAQGERFDLDGLPRRRHQTSTTTLADDDGARHESGWLGLQQCEHCHYGKQYRAFGSLLGLCANNVAQLLD